MDRNNLRKLILPSGLVAGDNIIVLGGQLSAGIGSIRVWQIDLETSAAVTITPKSNGTIVPGSITLTGPGATATLQNTQTPWMETLPGQNLVWNLTAGGTLAGAIWYSLA